jgi:hypothetical protein
MGARFLAVLAALLIGVGFAAAADIDTDGDGLSDYQEMHKYLTDPKTPDTDGDGTPDGDWDERREYTYSIRTVLRYMPSYDEDALNDDYQDARLLKRTESYVELEIVHYPLSTAGQDIGQNPNWLRDYAGMKDYLRPGVTTNWDAKMRRDLLAELETAGIDPHAITDRQVVEKVSTWLMRRSRYLSKVFTTYYVH